MSLRIDGLTCKTPAFQTEKKTPETCLNMKTTLLVLAVLSLARGVHNLEQGHSKTSFGKFDEAATANSSLTDYVVTQCKEKASLSEKRFFFTTSYYKALLGNQRDPELEKQIALCTTIEELIEIWECRTDLLIKRTLEHRSGDPDYVNYRYMEASIPLCRARILRDAFRVDHPCEREIFDSRLQVLATALHEKPFLESNWKMLKTLNDRRITHECRNLFRKTRQTANNRRHEL